jgi:hypothetical protein
MNGHRNRRDKENARRNKCLHVERKSGEACDSPSHDVYEDTRRNTDSWNLVLTVLSSSKARAPLAHRSDLPQFLRVLLLHQKNIWVTG